MASGKRVTLAEVYRLKKREVEGNNKEVKQNMELAKELVPKASRNGC